jgi:hypothetical protein
VGGGCRPSSRHSTGAEQAPACHRPGHCNQSLRLS